MTSLPQVLVRVLGAGLPHALVDGRLGEADELARDWAAGSGRVPARWAVFLVAAENVLGDRRDPVLWRHLPTLVVPGCGLVVAGSLLVVTTRSINGATAAAGYVEVAMLAAVLALVLALPAGCPRRAVAALSLVPAALLVGGAGRSEPVMATDRLSSAALVVAAVLVPAAWLPLALGGRGLAWATARALIRGSRRASWTWSALGITLALIGAAELVGAIAGPLAAGPGHPAIAELLGRCLVAAGVLLGAVAIRCTLTCVEAVRPTP